MAAELAALREDRAADALASDAAALNMAPASAAADGPAPGAAVGLRGAGSAMDTGPSPADGAAHAAPAAATAAAARAAGREDAAEVLRRTQEELHRARSEVGRVGQLNRYLNETRAERDRLLQENASLKKAAPSAEQKLSDDAAARLVELSHKVKGFPELEGLVSAVSGALHAAQTTAERTAKQAAEHAVAPLQELRAEQAQRAQEQRTAAYEAAMQTFQSTYPNAVEVVRSTEFNSWIHTQPQPIQAAFYRGQEPGEAIAVMDAYDAHLRRAGRAPIAQYPQQQPAAQQRASVNAARLQSAAGLPSRASGAKGGLPPEDDFEASLDFFRRQRLAGAARAG